MAEEKKQTVPEGDISIKQVILRFREWYLYLRHKWVIILVACIIGGAIGLIYSIVKKPEYKAILTFALEEKNSGSTLSAYAGLASQFGIDIGGGGGGVFSGDNIMELMKSRRIVTKTLLNSITQNGKTQSLADYYITVNGLRKKWGKIKNFPVQISFPANINTDSLSYIQDSLIGVFYGEIIKKNLSISKPSTKASIIAVTFSAYNEFFAKSFEDSLVKNVSSFYILTKTERMLSNLQIVQSRLDSVKSAFSAALYGTAINMDLNLNPARAVVSVPGMKNEAEAKVLGAEYGELVKNLELVKMTLLQETPLIQVIDRPVLPLKIEKTGHIKGIIVGALISLIIIVVSLLTKYFFIKLFAQ